MAKAVVNKEHSIECIIALDIKYCYTALVIRASCTGTETGCLGQGNRTEDPDKSPGSFSKLIFGKDFKDTDQLCTYCI